MSPRPTVSCRYLTRRCPAASSRPGGGSRWSPAPSCRGATRTRKGPSRTCADPRSARASASLAVRSFEHARNLLPRRRRVHLRSAAHRVSAPSRRRGVGRAAQQLLLVYAGRHLRAAARVLVLAGHAASRAPQHLTATRRETPFALLVLGTESFVAPLTGAMRCLMIRMWRGRACPTTPRDIYLTRSTAPSDSNHLLLACGPARE